LRGVAQSLLQRAPARGSTSERCAFAQGVSTVGQKVRAIAREAFQGLLKLVEHLFAQGQSCEPILDMVMPAYTMRRARPIAMVISKSCEIDGELTSTAFQVHEMDIRGRAVISLHRKQRQPHLRLVRPRPGMARALWGYLFLFYLIFRSRCLFIISMLSNRATLLPPVKLSPGYCWSTPKYRNWYA
jgi:hypothetical protein